METIQIDIKKIKLNSRNPRVIRDERFKLLVRSLQDFPEMASVRSLVVNKDLMVLGGSQRFKAMKEAGWKTVPCQIVDWSPEKQREFIIKDNVSFGDNDLSVMLEDNDREDLENWGIETLESLDNNEDEKKPPKPASEVKHSHLAFAPIHKKLKTAGMEYFCLFRNNSMDLEKLKEEIKNTEVFVWPLVVYLQKKKIKTLIMAPPGSRAEKNGFHFLFEILKNVLEVIPEVQIISPFESNRNKITLKPGIDTSIKGIFLDDIITRGTTMKKAVTLYPGIVGSVIILSNH